jgi:putative membrane protein
MIKMLFKLIVNCLALVLVVKIVPGIYFDGGLSLVAMAILLGALNTFLRPVLVLVTLPISIMSLGLFTLVINGLLFYLAAALISGVTVNGFWAAFWGALLFSIISTILSWFAGTSGSVKVSSNFGKRRAHGTDGAQIRPEGKIIDVESKPLDEEKHGQHRLS